MKQKAQVGDRVILSNQAPKTLRKRYGTKVGRIEVTRTVYGLYDSNSRVLYTVRFPSQLEQLWSYEFNIID